MPSAKIPRLHSGVTITWRSGLLPTFFFTRPPEPRSLVSFTMAQTHLPMDSSSFNNDGIVRLCQQYKALQLPLLSPEETDRKVIRVSDGVVVKFGPGVTRSEACAQQIAFQHVDPKALRIPRVYHFFEGPGMHSLKTGYLVMEYIEGVTLEQMGWEQPGMLMRLVAAVNAINSISSTVPGPVSGGEAQHPLWSECGSDTEFPHVDDLNAYLNERLSFFHKEILVREDELCLCHMDLAPRNFMIDRRGNLCLLDWGTAGCYPRYFELWAIEFTRWGMETSFGPELVQSLKPTPEEKLQLETLSLVYGYNSHYGRYDDDRVPLLTPPSRLFSHPP